MTRETSTPRAELADLRGDIRHWRRGRATATLGEVVQDVYVVVFAALLFGSMLVSVLVNVGDVLTGLCTASDCREARSVLPWATGLALVVAVLAACRLFGPVFVTPAAGSWLLTAPVDRGLLLRPRLAMALGLATLAGLPAAAVALLAGFDALASVWLAALTSLLGVAAAALAALFQGEPGRRQFDPEARTRAGSGTSFLPWVPAGPERTRALTWTLTGALWVVLLVLAIGRGPLVAEPSGWGGWAALAVACVGAVALALPAVRSLARLRRREVSPGGVLAPNLSGALAMLDLALFYDVLLAHQARRRGSVRPLRGGPSGVWSLVWVDLSRLRRAPGSMAVLAGAVVLPYVAATAGLGRATVLVATLAGFLAGLPLLSGLRVLSRTPGMARNLPWGGGSTRRTAVLVPGLLLAAYGLACWPAVTDGIAPGTGMSVGLATGLAALSSAVRWVTGRPPDYGRPLVSTPAGGVPTNLYGSAFRGFDILVLTTVPLLLAETSTGVLISIALSAAVLGYLTGRPLEK